MYVTIDYVMVDQNYIQLALIQDYTYKSTHRYT